MTCRATYRWLMTLLLATCALIGGPSYAADTTELKAKQIWQLLDYVAVDYGGAVALRLKSVPSSPRSSNRGDDARFSTHIQDGLTGRIRFRDHFDLSSCNLTKA